MESSEQHHAVIPPVIQTATASNWQQNFHRPVESPHGTVLSTVSYESTKPTQPQLPPTKMDNINIDESSIVNSSNRVTTKQMNNEATKLSAESDKTSNFTSSMLPPTSKENTIPIAAPVPVITNTNLSASVENRNVNGPEVLQNRSNYVNHHESSNVANPSMLRRNENDGEFKGGGYQTQSPLQGHQYHSPLQNHPTQSNYPYHSTYHQYNQHYQHHQASTHYSQYPSHPNQHYQQPPQQPHHNQHHHHHQQQQQQHQHPQKSQQNPMQPQQNESSSTNMYTNRIGTDEKYSPINGSSVISNKKSDILINDRSSSSSTFALATNYDNNKLNYYKNCDPNQTETTTKVNNINYANHHPHHNQMQQNQQQPTSLPYHHQPPLPLSSLSSMQHPHPQHQSKYSQNTHPTLGGVDYEKSTPTSVISRPKDYDINRREQQHSTDAYKTVDIAGDETKYKPNPLYTSNPDFSKVSKPTTSSPHLAQLQMKTPDFSKAATSNSSLHVSNPDFAKSYKERPNQMNATDPTASHVNPSNFAEISKKYNYVSDLQLKKPNSSSQPSVLPPPSSASPATTSSSQSHMNLYVKPPDFTGSKQKFLDRDGKGLEEPTAHVIHKSHYVKSLAEKKIIEEDHTKKLSQYRINDAQSYKPEQQNIEVRAQEQYSRNLESRYTHPTHYPPSHHTPPAPHPSSVIEKGSEQNKYYPDNYYKNTAGYPYPQPRSGAVPPGPNYSTYNAPQTAQKSKSEPHPLPSRPQPPYYPQIPDKTPQPPRHIESPNQGGPSHSSYQHTFSNQPSPVHSTPSPHHKSAQGLMNPPQNWPGQSSQGYRPSQSPNTHSPVTSYKTPSPVQSPHGKPASTYQSSNPVDYVDLTRTPKPVDYNRYPPTSSNIDINYYNRALHPDVSIRLSEHEHPNSNQPSSHQPPYSAYPQSAPSSISRASSSETLASATRKYPSASEGYYPSSYYPQQSTSKARHPEPHRDVPRESTYKYSTSTYTPQSYPQHMPSSSHTNRQPAENQPPESYQSSRPSLHRDVRPSNILPPQNPLSSGVIPPRKPPEVIPNSVPSRARPHENPITGKYNATITVPPIVKAEAPTGIEINLKKESPLDLSVKTIKTKADSTGCDTNVISSRHNSALKVDFYPNFSNHEARERDRHYHIPSSIPPSSSVPTKSNERSVDRSVERYSDRVPVPTHPVQHGSSIYESKSDEPSDRIPNPKPIMKSYNTPESSYPHHIRDRSKEMPPYASSSKTQHPPRLDVNSAQYHQDRMFVERILKNNMSTNPFTYKPPTQDKNVKYHTPVEHASSQSRKRLVSTDPPSSDAVLPPPAKHSRTEQQQKTVTELYQNHLNNLKREAHNASHHTNDPHHPGPYGNHNSYSPYHHHHKPGNDHKPESYTASFNRSSQYYPQTQQHLNSVTKVQTEIPPKQENIVQPPYSSSQHEYQRQHHLGEHSQKHMHHPHISRTYPPQLPSHLQQQHPHHYQHAPPAGSDHRLKPPTIPQTAIPQQLQSPPMVTHSQPIPSSTLTTTPTTNNVTKVNDQNIISKLRSNLAMKEYEKQKLLKKQSSIEINSNEDDNSRADINSILAARIRTKGELKGFHPIPPPPPSSSSPTNVIPANVISNQASVIQHPPQKQLSQSIAHNQQNDDSKENLPQHINPPSDIEGASAFDLMDWGKKCNDFVAELQTGESKKRNRRRIKRKSISSNVNVLLETSKEVVYNGNQVTNIKEENNFNMIQKETKEQSTSDEDKPLLLLRQQSNFDRGTENEKIDDNPNTRFMLKRNAFDKFDERIERNMKEKQRMEREKELAARLGNSSSDDENQTIRPRKRIRKLKTRASLQIRLSVEDTDEENDEVSPRKLQFIKSQTDTESTPLKEANRRKNFSRIIETPKSSSGDESHTENKTDIKEKLSITSLDDDKKRTESIEIQPQENLKTIDEKVEKTDEQFPISSSSSSPPTSKDIANEIECKEESIKVNPKIDDKTDIISDEKEIKIDEKVDETKEISVDYKKKNETCSKNEETLSHKATLPIVSINKIQPQFQKHQTPSPPKRLSVKNVDNLVTPGDKDKPEFKDETMTRSKRKREIEERLSNSKILRNEKIVQNIITPKKSTPRKSTITTSNAASIPPTNCSSGKNDDIKRKVESDSDDKSSSAVKSKKKARVSSESESEEEIEMKTNFSERYVYIV